MRIVLREPVSPRYIYINPETHQIHLMVPIVGGQEISTDNTCKAIRKHVFPLKSYKILPAWMSIITRPFSFADLIFSAIVLNNGIRSWGF
nr:hypothetical protein [Legionella anisa]